MRHEYHRLSVKVMPCIDKINVVHVLSVKASVACNMVSGTAVLLDVVHYAMEVIIVALLCEVLVTKLNTAHFMWLHMVG